MFGNAAYVSPYAELEAEMGMSDIGRKMAARTN